MRMKNLSKKGEASEAHQIEQPNTSTSNNHAALVAQSFSSPTAGYSGEESMDNSGAQFCQENVA